MRKHVIITMPMFIMMWVRWCEYRSTTTYPIVVDVVAMGIALATAIAITNTMAREITLYYRNKH